MYVCQCRCITSILVHKFSVPELIFECNCGMDAMWHEKSAYMRRKIAIESSNQLTKEVDVSDKCSTFECIDDVIDLRAHAQMFMHMLNCLYL